MKLVLENLPPSLQPQRETLARCLEAMNQALPLRRAILFGSHARGEARSDSDVDLCLVADGAERQLEAAARFREAIWDVWPHPPFTLVPITSARLGEKQAAGDYFLEVFSKKECCLPRKTDSNNPADWLLIADSDIEGLGLLAEREAG